MFTIYSTATCKFCKLAKDLLDFRGIPYTEIRIDDGSPEALLGIEKMKAVEYAQVPAIFTTDTDRFIGGYDKLQEELAKRF
jgi:glutaredoxin